MFTVLSVPGRLQNPAIMKAFALRITENITENIHILDPSNFECLSLRTNMVVNCLVCESISDWSCVCFGLLSDFVCSFRWRYRLCLFTRLFTRLFICLFTCLFLMYFFIFELKSCTYYYCSIGHCSIGHVSWDLSVGIELTNVIKLAYHRVLVLMLFHFLLLWYVMFDALQQIVIKCSLPFLGYKTSLSLL